MSRGSHGARSDGPAAAGISDRQGPVDLSDSAVAADSNGNGAWFAQQIARFVLMTSWHAHHALSGIQNHCLSKVCSPYVMYDPGTV